MLMLRRLSRPASLLALFLVALSGACTAFELTTEIENPPEMLEMGKFCLPVGLSVKGPSPDTAASGTWVYLGYSARGSLKAIVQRGAATPLPEESFAAELELQPRTQPVDIRPSSDSMDSSARFRFHVYANGEKCTEPVRYSASRLGR